jgi:hypothetical protein
VQEARTTNAFLCRKGKDGRAHSPARVAAGRTGRPARAETELLNILMVQLRLAAQGASSREYWPPTVSSAAVERPATDVGSPQER